MATVEPILVFFRMEISTKDHNNVCDISQIVLKSGSSTFNKYVDPTMEISEEVTAINHLMIHNSKIYKDRVMKRSWPLNVVLEEMLQYLKKLNGPCTLIGHKCCLSNASLLIRAISDLSMENKFGSVIAGFTDTFYMFADIFPEKDTKKLTLHALAKDINVRAQQSFNCGRSIKDNARILEKLALHHFSPAELKAKRSFYTELQKIQNLKGVTGKMPQAVCTLATGNFCVVEQVMVQPPKKKQKVVEKKEKKVRKSKNKVAKHEDPCGAAKDVENVEKAEEIPEISSSGRTTIDVFLPRDDGTNVNDHKSVKNRRGKADKPGKIKKSRRKLESLEED